MPKLRRKCRLADISHRNVDLRKYEQLIIDTINNTVPNKNPRVYKDHFSTDWLTQGESVLVGRALSKIEALKKYGRKVTVFRLFEGYTCEDEKDDMKNPKGGRMK